MKRGITINFSNKTFYTLIAIISLLIISAVAYAVGSGNVPNPGHAIEELETCDDGETLIVVNDSWTCGAAGNQKICYCLVCAEGSDRSTTGPSCGEAGAWSGMSDMSGITVDSKGVTSTGGCDLKAWLIPIGTDCNYPANYP